MRRSATPRPRRLWGILLGALALLGAACDGSADAARPPSGPPTVVTTSTVLADLITAVGGAHVDVQALVPVGGDPHVHEPRPSDAVAVADADLVVDNGFGLSPWMGPLLDTRQGPTLILADALGDEVRRVDGTLDPHLWMVPDVVADGYVPTIADALVDLVPEAAGTIAQRAERFRVELDELDDEVRDILAGVPEDRRLLVTSHDAYGYFAEAYDLTVVGTVVGVTTEEEPSARTVATLVDRIEDLGVPAVFVETTVNPAVIERIATDAGVTLGEPLLGDSLGEPGSGADTYGGMLRTNARRIAEALS